MSEKKAKEKRRIGKNDSDLVYEVLIKTFSDNTVSVSSNVDKALDNPILYTSIVNAMNHAIVGRWMENQERHQKRNQTTILNSARTPA